MTAAMLLAKLVRRGVKLVPAGGRLRFHPRSALTPEELEQLAQHKPELLRLLSAAEDDGKCCDNSDDDPYLANEWNWAAISRADFAYLTGPRSYPAPCQWCGGRTRHNPLCDELRASWEVTIPFGKYRGRKLSELPTDYLLWLRDREGELPSDLRRATCDELLRRTNRN